MILLKSLWRNDTSLRYRLRLDPRMWLWSLQFLRNCTTARNRAATKTKIKLCLYSQAETLRVGREEGLDWDRTAKGAIYLYSDPRSVSRRQGEHALHRRSGRSRSTCSSPINWWHWSRRSPRRRTSFAGGMHTPGDESGDARKFTAGPGRTLPRRWASPSASAKPSPASSMQGKRVTGIETDKGRVTGDQYVLALGSYAPLLSRTLGFNLPIFPVKGYSVTLPIADPAEAPTHFGGVHEAHLVAFSRLGDRLRLTATADFAGYDTELRARATSRHMLRCGARSCSPRPPLYDRPDYWACLRPDDAGRPADHGAARRSANLWLNTGHGHMGWTMACGSSPHSSSTRCWAGSPRSTTTPFHHAYWDSVFVMVWRQLCQIRNAHCRRSAR